MKTRNLKQHNTQKQNAKSDYKTSTDIERTYKNTKRTQ